MVGAVAAEEDEATSSHSCASIPEMALIIWEQLEEGGWRKEGIINQKVVHAYGLLRTSIEIISRSEGLIPSEDAELLSVLLLLSELPLRHGGLEAERSLPGLHRGPICCSITDHRYQQRVPELDAVHPFLH